MPPLLEANPIVAHVESCVVLANLSSGFSKGTLRLATDTTQRRRSSADSTLGKGQPARLSFRRLFQSGLYEYTSQLIYLTRKIQRHCLQDFHGVTPMTFVFQLRNAFVEGAQFAFQFLNFMLNGKPPNRIFFTGWLFLSSLTSRVVTRFIRDSQRHVSTRNRRYIPRPVRAAELTFLSRLA
jgi:hypothetical protein